MKNIEIVRSRRKTLAIEITKDCRVLVRAPLRATQTQIDTFVARHAVWIETHLTQQAQRAAAAPPPPDEEEIAALKEQARAVLPGRVAYWSRVTGLTPTAVKISAARTRYGSCSGKNSITFSCFLMQYPVEAIDLVIVHELCHIWEKNHGKRFYTLLAQYLPDYQERKKLLKR